MNDDLPIGPAGSEQCRIEHVRPVGGCEHNDSFVTGKAIHLSQDLVECLLALVMPSERAPARARPIVSISSMKMIAGATFRASPNNSRTRLAPTPTIISMNSEALALKNGTLASPAVARASRVLPVPGAPARSTPLGERAPRRRYFPGFFKNLERSASTASRAVRFHGLSARGSPTLLVRPDCE